jgi:hypothetical protein
MPEPQPGEFDAEALQADLDSHDANKVARGLKSLLRAMHERAFVPVRLPDPDCLDAFGDQVPEDILETYLRVTDHYQMFEPTPTRKEINENMIDAVILFGKGQGALAVALAIQGSNWPEDSAKHAISHICKHQFLNENEVLGAYWIIDFLLDVRSLRAIVVERLADHALDGFIDDLIRKVMPVLTEAEQRKFRPLTPVRRS